MMRRARSLIASLLFLSAGIAPAFGATAEPTSSAMQWLRLIDVGQYAQAYADAGAIYHARITEAAFEAKARLYRDTVGALVRREVESYSSTGTLKNMPAGNYSIVRFRSHFKDRDDGREIVYLSLESGLWRVAGYEIR